MNLLSLQNQQESQIKIIKFYQQKNYKPQQFLFMSGTSDYLDRLKSIREKYGCSQPKTQSSYSEQMLNAERPAALDRPLGYQKVSGSNYYKADAYVADKMKILDPHLPSSTGLALNAKSTDYSLRPQSSIGLGASQPQAPGDYLRRADRQREIEQIRENYAASRRKVIQDFSAKTYTRDYSKDPTKDYLKGQKAQRDYLKDHTRQYRDQLKSELPVASTKIDLLSRAEQSVSPIKRMSDYEEKKSYRARELETSDSFWKQREAKLSQMTANRLNENTRASILKDEKYGQKNYSGKRSGLHDQLKTYNEPSTIARRQMQNRADGYSVTNIDRIQQRIQSILNKR